MKPYLLTKMVGGAKMTSHCRRCVGNQVQSDSIFLNTMHNTLQQQNSLKFIEKYIIGGAMVPKWVFSQKNSVKSSTLPVVALGG